MTQCVLMVAVSPDTVSPDRKTLHMHRQSSTLMAFIMQPVVFTLLFLIMHSCDVTGSSCHSDRNKDHRPRVSCVNQRLTALPGGIDPQTQVLVLTGNQFSSVTWSDYSSFTRLHELDLSHNQISALEPPGPVLENLSVLRLSGNRLTGLGGEVFRCAPSLMEIYLDGNRIRSLHDATFSRLIRLEVIDLSGNDLPALPARLLKHVSSGGLKTLDMENNSISLMPDGFFSSKPELPYVYLSLNPWLCSCAIGYLHSFLNDQEHNIYKHQGPNDIVPGADSVVCAGPPHLRGRAIIELEENDFCPAQPTFSSPLHHSQDLDFKPHTELVNYFKYPPQLVTTTLKKVVTSHHMSNTAHDTTSFGHVSSSTRTWMPTSLVTLQSRTNTWRNRLTERLHLDTVTSVLWSAGGGPVTSEDPLRQAPTHHSSELSVDTTQAQSQTSITLVTAQPVPQSSGKFTGQPPPQTSAQPVEQATIIGPFWAEGAGSRAVSGRVLPWCWWLFAGFVLLCMLSVLTSCFLFIWLLKNYLVLYRRLKRYSPTCPDSDGVALCVYRRTENPAPPQWGENRERVSFLTPEQIKAVQPIFRSVLFISKKDDKDEGMRDRQADGREVSTTVELVSAVEEEIAKHRKDAEQTIRGKVFRKTLSRVISEEKETNRWKEQHWDGNRERLTRYSLILREATGSERNMEWLVGTWELGERGVVCENSSSLIGHHESKLSSTDALE